MKKLFLDSETFSATPISDGTYAYAADAEVMLLAYAYENDPVQVVDLTAGETLPQYLIDDLTDPDYLKVIHNSMFDRSVLRYGMGIKIPPEQIFDTMVCALAHSLPGALKMLCEVLQVNDDDVKDDRGKELIQLFCKPRPKNQKVRRFTRETNPKEWQEFKDYAGSDIKAMRAVFNKIPTWNYRGRELELWRLDQRINDRGFRIDRDLAVSAIEAVAEAQAGLADDVVIRTFGEVGKATQRDRLLKFILEYYGVDLPDMTKSTLERRLNDPDLPRAVKELIAIRLEASMASTSKYKALLKSVSDDDRLRGTLQFCGASRTARWSGRTFQPQNLFRPTLKNEVIEEGIETLKTGHANLILPNVMEVAANAVRGCIVASEGKKLVVSDLSTIEGRFAAWVAGETRKLKAFADFDKGIGPDLYKLAYARAFGIDPADVTKDNRQIGKVMELACFTGDTKVLTNNGVKAMLALTLEDLLWDGVEWVKHEGLVAKGVKKVVNVADIQLTPDHLILTNKTWTPALQLVLNENILSQALATASAKTPLSVLTTAQRAASSLSECNVLVEGRSTTSFTPTSSKVSVWRAVNVLLREAVSGVKNITAMQTSYLMMTTGNGYYAGYPPASIGVGIQKMQDTPITAAEVFASTNLGLPIVAPFSSISLRWKGGINRIWSLIGRTLIKGTSRGIFGLLPRQKIKAIDEKSSQCKNASSFWKPVYDVVNAGPRHRFTVVSDKGPLLVHNCGYEGGVGAYIAMAAAYRMDLDEMAQKALPTIPSHIREEALGFWARSVKTNRSTFGLERDTFVVCDSLKRMWRAAHPAVSSMWPALREAYAQACSQPGRPFHVGKVIVQKDGVWLRIRLPSGRVLCYAGAEVGDKGQLSYLGINPYSRKWTRRKTYGGDLFESVCQGGSRDIMAHNMPMIDAKNYSIILTVHDELITEAPDTDDFTDEELSALMSTNPPWADGLPLAAGGFTSYRYKKE